ncbi:MAG: hypothetical protein WC581_09240 [Thermodesulfovibrionales bacterium]
MRTFQLPAILLILFIVFASGCNGPELTTVEYGEIDASQDPVQTPYEQDETFTITVKDGRFSIKPLAEYKISAVVAGKESYSYGWSGKVAPVDLALAWGKIAESENTKYVSFSQSDRWYFFTYKPEGPFDASYISRHSANNHIIPATENVLKAVKSVKEREKIIFEGFLVNLTGTVEGQKVSWGTSLTRNDSGDSSCELFYVTKVRIDNKVYQ